MSKKRVKNTSAASKQRMKQIVRETIDHSARLGVELLKDSPDSVENAKSILIEWEAIQDPDRCLLDRAWFDRDASVDFARPGYSALLSPEALASWKVLQSCMVASTTCKLDVVGNDRMGALGPQEDMDILSPLAEEDVCALFARYEILDRFGWRTRFTQFTVVRDARTGSVQCIVRGPLHEVASMLLNGHVVGGQVVERSSRSPLQALQGELDRATNEEGKQIVVYGMLDVDKLTGARRGSAAADPGVPDVDLPSRDVLRASTMYSFVGATSTTNEVSAANMEAIHKLRKRQVSIVFTSTVIDTRTFAGIARAKFDMDIEDWTLSDSPPPRTGAPAIVCSAPRIARAIKTDLNEYERFAQARLIFSSARGRDVGELIDAAASIEDNFVCLGSPELLSQCTRAAFRVTTRSTRHVEGPLLPYMHSALAMRREAFTFHDPLDVEDLPVVEYGDDAEEASVLASVVIDSDAHIETGDALVPFAAFLRYRQHSRYQDAQIAFETDPTPGARIAWQLAVFWFLPILIVAVWMMVPLSYSGGGEQDFWAFVVYHTGYQVEAMFFGVLLFGLTLPVPSFISVTFILAVTAALNMTYLVLVRVVGDTQFTPINVAPSTFPIALAFFSWYLHFLHTKHRSAHVPERYVKETTTEAAHFGIIYMVRNVVASKQDRDVFSGIRLPVYLVEYALYIVIAAAILTLYYYCQLFTAFYGTIESESLKVAFAFLYGIPLTFIGNVMLTAADQIEARGLAMPRQGTLGVLVICIIELFHQIFYKGLFTEVTELGTFLGLQAVSAMLQFIMFPIRMSRVFFDRRTAFFRKFDPSNHLLSSLLGEVGGADVTIETYRHDLTVEFCAVSMAQRIAGTMFLVGLFIVRFTPNGEFLKLSNLDKDEYDQLVVFTLIMLVIEWLISTVIHLIIRAWHKLDALLVGGTAIDRSKCLWVLVAVTVHILLDYFIAINRLATVGA